MEGGIIDRAKEAVMRSDCATLVEAYNLAYNTAKIDEVTGKVKEINKIKILKEVVEDLSLKGFSFNVDNNEVEYIGDNEEIRTWVINNFLFEDILEAGYIVSLIGEELYLTGIDFKVELMGEVTITVEDVIEKLGNRYNIKNAEGNDATMEERITTGCVIEREDGKKLTVVIKGDNRLNGLINAGNITIITTGEIENLTKAAILASDVNNDGFISLDDANFINAGKPINFQSVKMTKMPEIINEKELYTWYTSDNVKETLNKKYPIESGWFIVIPPNTKYSKLEEELNTIFQSESGITVKTENKSAIIEEGDIIEAEFSLELSEGVYAGSGAYIIYQAKIKQ